MATYTETQVIEYATALQRETDLLRGEAADHRQVYGMYRLPQLPRDLIRQNAVYILSPDVIDEEKKIRAMMLTFETEVTCLPTERTKAGTVKQADQTAADEIERAGAVFLRKLNPNRQLDSNVTWGQCIEGVVAVVFEMHGIDSPNPAERFCWEAYDIDLEGCGWIESKPTIPSVFSRQ